MQKIGLVVAFSEICTPLLEHFLLTFNKNVLPSIQSDVQIDIHVYQCNFAILIKEQYKASRTTRHVPPGSFAYLPFGRKTNLDHLSLKSKVFMHDCSNSSFGHSDFYLPDIAVYQDFYDKQFMNYDYLMFCHDDITFYHPTDMVDNMLFLLNGSYYNIVSKCTANFNSDLSLRFHPAMVFVKSSTMQTCRLSFINDLSLFNHGFRIFPDGGAGLLASYYHNNNVMKDNRPYTEIPSSWFTHIRALGDTGVEFCYQLFRDNIEFKDTMDFVKNYNDRLLFGEH